ncbi:MAG: hypothetical protein IJZ09_00105 [Tidjanibacter sp.]|nr:hypothetical protein [Tidjanibacter sp.]
MNEEKNFAVAVAPKVARTQKVAWWLMLVGVALGAISSRLLFAEPLLMLVAFLMLGKVASNHVVRLACKRMVWVQAVIAVALLALSLMWIDLGEGDMLAVDWAVALLWGVNVWCYAAIARSKTLSNENLGWLNVIATLLIVRIVSIAFGFINFYEAYRIIHIAWAVVIIVAWKKVLSSEAFAGAGLTIATVEPREAFRVFTKYTILCLVPIVVAAVVLLFE